MAKNDDVNSMMYNNDCERRRLLNKHQYWIYTDNIWPMILFDWKKKHES